MPGVKTEGCPPDLWALEPARGPLHVHVRLQVRRVLVRVFEVQRVLAAPGVLVRLGLQQPIAVPRVVEVRQEQLLVHLRADLTDTRPEVGFINQRNKGSKDQRIKGSKDQRIKKTKDQRIKGSKD